LAIVVIVVRAVAIIVGAVAIIVGIYIQIGSYIQDCRTIASEVGAHVFVLGQEGRVLSQSCVEFGRNGTACTIGRNRCCQNWHRRRVDILGSNCRIVMIIDSIYVDTDFVGPSQA
jgi:hypothetical protein